MERGACVTNRLFPKLYWCGRKALFSAGSQEGFPDVDTMPISVQKPSMWENPNSFLPSSLSTINIYLASFSQFPVCTHVCMYAPCVYGSLRLLSGNRNHPPLYTKARSLNQTQSSPIWLVLLISLLWGIPPLTFQAGIIRWDYHEHRLSSYLICPLSYLPSPLSPF